MKANQAFKANDEAVSPVIGVILMVAITVVLAAVVFVLVSNLSKNSNTAAPNVTFSQDQSAHTLQIVSADASANWGSVKQVTSGAGVVTNDCVVKFAGTSTVASGSAIGTAGQAIVAGDSLTVSKATTGSCSVSLTYTTVNQLLGSWTFNF